MKFSSIVCFSTAAALTKVSAYSVTPTTKPSFGHRSSSLQASTSLIPPQGSATFSSQQDVRVLQPRTKTPENGKGVSLPLIRAIWLNQGTFFLGSTLLTALGVLLSNHGDLSGIADLHWNGSTASFTSFFDWHATPWRIVQGVLATIPLVTMGSAVERSDNRDASHINFSTTNMVIRLFGRRQTAQDDASGSIGTAQMILLSLTMALSTGIAEEFVFRGYLPAAIEGVTHSIPLAILLQASLFAVGHFSPHVSKGENRIIGGLQLGNGMWYGMVYLLTGGDLLPCIISHVLYDMHIFCGTWHCINDQLDYTQRVYPQSLSKAEEERIQAQVGKDLSTDSINFARRFFFAFDYDHKGSLSHSDVQRAMTYAFLMDKVEPTPQDVTKAFRAALARRPAEDDHPPERLTTSEFLSLLVNLKRQSRVR